MPRATTFKFINESSCECSECGLVLTRPSDMRRHMHTHGIGMSQVKYQCTWADCSYETIQKSNFDTHYRTHLQDKSRACPSCDFKTCDPGSLTRHRKRIHGYVPKPRKARATKRQQDTSSDRSISPTLTSVSSESISGLSSPSSSSSPSSESTIDFSSLTLASEVEPTTTLHIDEEICKPFFPEVLPTDVDLFYEPDSVSGFGYSTFDDLRPRPLFPAVESTPSLELFQPLHSSFSPDFSLLLAATHKTLPSPTINHVDDQALYNIPCGVFLENVCDEFLHQPLPTPYDSFIQQMAEMDPSVFVTISDYDFRVIFGCDYEHFVAARARSPSPWSNTLGSSINHVTSSIPGSSINPITSTTSSPTPKPFTGSLLAELYAP
ncbi:uncharacterized protein C8R40DRAFT_1172048 [Lentinula edodes]|uniref:uncharacterized protein n=1 Tax=Lentinula edodes TaxID=5353 RepID=UPI001E8ED727|nr:uncharacterized protein C8R40DRAFT_1172048 [Lentinula edodes]KAH7874117.1 hypothetical protein C8R40DRAFT_1172048 [Lentinula edodes]KAJ3917424.1 hypothetical protein F5877DRAFT_68235 [Lentinula edodes]